MFSNVVPKIVPFVGYCRKIWLSQRGRTQYGSCAFHAGEVRLHERKNMPVLLHPTPTYMHSPTCERARTHTHTQRKV